MPEKNINYKIRLIFIFAVVFFIIFILSSSINTAAAATAKKSAAAKNNRDECGRKVIIIPLDARNQTYDYIQYIVRICGYDPLVPPLAIMGNLSEPENSYKKQMNVWFWLRSAVDQKCGIIIISADSLIYGGLVESRVSPITERESLKNADLIKLVRKKFPKTKILVFTSIPRKDAKFRSRNLTVNAHLVSLVKEKYIDYLSISGDDATDIANQVKDIVYLKDIISKYKVEDKVFISDVDRIRLGIDESAMVLFARYLNLKGRDRFKIYVEYRDISAARIDIDKYSATPIMSIAIDIIDAAGADVVYNPKEADLVLAINHPSPKYNEDNFIRRIEKLTAIKPVTVGDLTARGQRGEFFETLVGRGLFIKLAGYASWGMGTNTLGTAVAMGVACTKVKGRGEFIEFMAFLFERMVTDYIYIDKVHMQLAEASNIAAYSLDRMTCEQETRATQIANFLIAKNLSRLGIIYKIELDENGKKRTTGQLPAEFIPLESAELGRCFPANARFIFNVNIDRGSSACGAKFGGPAEVIVGPISFPFHRLFEIRIPVKFKSNS